MVVSSNEMHYQLHEVLSGPYSERHVARISHILNSAYDTHQKHCAELFKILAPQVYINSGKARYYWSGTGESVSAVP